MEVSLQINLDVLGIVLNLSTFVFRERPVLGAGSEDEARMAESCAVLRGPGAMVVFL